MTETNRIEYKERLTKELELEKEAVAFLNYQAGGMIYIGIDKNGNTIGVSDIPRILRSYGQECFKFSENFLRMTFPAIIKNRAAHFAPCTSH
ncbi:MAG: helix-turn-helix domain-containing protein [Mangrovibacterium sp.]